MKLFKNQIEKGPLTLSPEQQSKLYNELYNELNNVKEYNSLEEAYAAYENERYGITEKEGLDKIIDILYEFRGGTPKKFNSDKGQFVYSVNEIAEKIFASHVDLNANEFDTNQLWEKCIDKAITIYFNYQLVEDKIEEFFNKPCPNYDNLPEEEKQEIKKICYVKH